MDRYDGELRKRKKDPYRRSNPIDVRRDYFIDDEDTLDSNGGVDLGNE